MKKTLEIIGGPNGSGKSTFAEVHFAKRKGATYINTDKIAIGIAPNGSEFAQYESGRIMLREIEQAILKKESFAFETTFSGRIWVSYLQKVKKLGYKIKIYFVFVNSIELSLKRIKTRVELGGHSVPEDIVRRRFARAFNNFMKLYMPLADEWFIVDNSKTKSVEIAKGKKNAKKIINQEVYNKYFL